VRLDVAFTPAEATSAPVGIVVDVLRATSSIAQALAAGYRRVLCCAEIDEARALREATEDAVVTTNGTRAILTAVSRCEEVLLGSLLNLNAVAAAARGRRRDVAVVCAGYKGAFALDDAYCAGRIVGLLEGDRTDAAIAAELVAGAFPSAAAALNARTYGPPGLEEDVVYCAQENLLDAVPRFSRMVGKAAEIELTRA
jgi:2-phosphosulfolactate phosphatase